MFFVKPIFKSMSNYEPILYTHCALEEEVGPSPKLEARDLGERCSTFSLELFSFESSKMLLNVGPSQRDRPGMRGWRSEADEKESLRGVSTFLSGKAWISA